MEFTESVTVLKKLLAIKPEYENAKVALAYAYLNLKDPDDAEILLEEARVTDPDNIFLLRNLGSLYAQKGEYERALKIFHHAEQVEPDNRQILYGIALVLFHQKEFNASSEYLKNIIARNIDDEFDERSKNLQREIAGKNFQINGLRMDAVYYCLAALEKYNEMSFTEIQGINYEISMLGRTGINPSDTETKYQLTCLPGDFTALQLLCYMYVGFKLVNPEIDIGFDLSKEYSAAKAMYSSQHGC